MSEKGFVLTNWLIDLAQAGRRRAGNELQILLQMHDRPLFGAGREQHPVNEGPHEHDPAPRLRRILGQTVEAGGVEAAAGVDHPDGADLVVDGEVDFVLVGRSGVYEYVRARL